jgi:acyl homoserine lactone synthase
MKTISGSFSEFSSDIEAAIAAYRHKIFIEKLGWPLPTENGLERDQFDRPDTLYVIARDTAGTICGCARLLPTTRPYLLGEIFPQLLDGAVPRSPDTWELSRFAAVGSDPDSASAFTTSQNTRRLLAAAIACAAEQGATRLITVSPLGVERLLHRLGVHAHRAGPPRYVDGKPVFACWIEIDGQTSDALDITIAPAGRHTH